MNKNRYPTISNSDNRLSRAISAISNEINKAQALNDNLISAPVECGAIIYKGLIQSIKQILQDTNYSPDDFIAEAISRTSYKYIYDLGLLDILDMEIKL